MPKHLLDIISKGKGQGSEKKVIIGKEYLHTYVEQTASGKT